MLRICLMDIFDTFYFQQSYIEKFVQEFVLVCTFYLPFCFVGMKMK